MLLVKAFTPTLRSSSHPKPYKTSFTKKQFDFLKTYFDIDLIHSIIMDKFEKQLVKKEIIWDDREPIEDEMNVLRQFVHLYNDKNISLAEVVEK